MNFLKQTIFINNKNLAQPTEAYSVTESQIFI